MDEDISDQIMLVQTVTKQMIAEMLERGIHPMIITAAVMPCLGFLWREMFQSEAERRKVVIHAAEVAITGKCQPIEPS